MVHEDCEFELDAELHHVSHRSGSAHRNADALTRRPCEVEGGCSQCRKGERVQVNQLARQSAPQHHRDFSCEEMTPAQLSSSAREDDRHDNVGRDSDRPLWQVDRPLCVGNLQPELAGSKSCESEDLEYQLTASKHGSRLALSGRRWKSRKITITACRRKTSVI